MLQERLILPHWLSIGSLSSQARRRRQRERHLKNVLNSRPIVFFAIIPTSLICIMRPNYPGAVFVGTVFKFEGKVHLLVLTSVHVLHKTLNAVISCSCFAENGKEMYRNVKRTCRVTVLLIKNHCFVTLSLPSSSSSSSLLKFPNDMKTTRRRNQI